MRSRFSLLVSFSIGVTACTAQPRDGQALHDSTVQGNHHSRPLIATYVDSTRKTSQSSQPKTTTAMSKITKTDDEWRNELTPQEYHVLREKGTDRPFTGEYVHLNEQGTYVCRGCGAELYSSETKFDSHCGWPSFYDAIDSGAIVETLDTSHGMRRTELTCAKCGSHLGHVFDDGPKPTGMRHCINSTSLQFQPASKK